MHVKVRDGIHNIRFVEVSLRAPAVVESVGAARVERGIVTNKELVPHLKLQMDIFSARITIPLTGLTRNCATPVKESRLNSIRICTPSSSRSPPTFSSTSDAGS